MTDGEEKVILRTRDERPATPVTVHSLHLALSDPLSHFLFLPLKNPALTAAPETVREARSQSR